MMPGKFPREFIASGENIVYETRPSIVPFIGIGAIIYLIIGLVILAYVSQFGIGIAVVFVFLIFVLIPLLSILFGLLRWSRTFYALTDRRILQSYGVFSRNVRDCPYDKVQHTRFSQGILGRLLGYANIVFQTAGITSIQERAVILGGGVFWRGTKDPLNTRRFVEEVTSYMQRSKKIQEFQDMARVLQASGTQMPGTVPPVAPSPGAKYCPKCGAQVPASAKFCASCGSTLP